MKKRTTLFLILSIIFATITISAFNIFNIENEIKKIVYDQNKISISYAAEQINEFDMILYGMNGNFSEIEKNSINSILKWFEEKKQNPLEVQDKALEDLVKKMSISEIYIIDKSGKIIHTSCKDDKKLNLDSIFSSFF